MAKLEASVSTIAGSPGSKCLRTGAMVNAVTSHCCACSILEEVCQSFAVKDVLLVMGRMILL